MPTASAARITNTDKMVARLRRANFRKRYAVDGGQAVTASSRKYRQRSSANPPADSYLRVRSFSRVFITIQSSSPRTSTLSFAGSVCRFAAVHTEHRRSTAELETRPRRVPRRRRTRPVGSAPRSNSARTHGTSRPVDTGYPGCAGFRVGIQSACDPDRRDATTLRLLSARAQRPR